MQQKPERFMVRTSHYVDDVRVTFNNVVESRPMAIKKAEKIGKIDELDHQLIRAFLEGNNGHHKAITLMSTDFDKGIVGTAYIYKIDE